MRIGELARRAGVTVKAVRYYESLGLLRAGRSANGYRDFDEVHLALVREVHLLGSLGIPADETRPFLDCILTGNSRGDDCSESLETYRATLATLDDRIRDLAARRDRIATLLSAADERSTPRCEFSTTIV
ncbi:DNA-binding transcriptional MerR regulator [Diaminobutyricimonas aerilata]|uniref:DNA-binding transcriptional MerR regulator n=1 Tax=Diaminobutyricimonas aerilata TaxID=1162967 RepID=A0A2M9CMI3_9MICO|nr:MerR family DNA-binding transcriptional regulator [Diaminobutyricimonas aerilata]PJJ73100.1 DNA-binding transcriptional MerR regulator [Diaminobutyricimonas aerilata]